MIPETHARWRALLAVAAAGLACASAGCHTPLFGREKHSIGIVNETDVPLITGAVSSEPISWSFSAVPAGGSRDCAWSFSCLPEKMSVRWKTKNGSYNEALDVPQMLPTPQPGRIWIVIQADNKVRLTQEPVRTKGAGW
jgi:hypothetical protein